MKNPRGRKVGNEVFWFSSYSEDGVTNVAVNITKLFGRREVVQ